MLLIIETGEFLLHLQRGLVSLIVPQACVKYIVYLINITCLMGVIVHMAVTSHASWRLISPITRLVSNICVTDIESPDNWYANL